MAKDPASSDLNFPFWINNPNANQQQHFTIPTTQPPQNNLQFSFPYNFTQALMNQFLTQQFHQNNHPQSYSNQPIVTSQPSPNPNYMQPQQNSNQHPPKKSFIAKFISNKTFPPHLKSYVKLSNELKRCKPNAKITNAYINSRDQLIIKTDSESDLNYLNADWDPNAFENGVTKIESEPKFYIAIYDVNTTFDTNDPENKKYMLENYNITNMLRIIKKSSNTPTELIKAIINDKEVFNKIIENKRIKIGHSYVRVAAWKFDLQPDQCYHCQKIGHLKQNCPDKDKLATCVRCAKKHAFACRITDPNEFKCVNCNQAHASCSKSCPKLIEEVKRKKEILEKKINKKSDKFTRVASAQPVVQKPNSLDSSQNQTTNLILFIIEMFKNLSRMQE